MTNYYYFLVSVYVTDLMIYSWLLKGAGKSLGKGQYSSVCCI